MMFSDRPDTILQDFTNLPDFTNVLEFLLFVCVYVYLLLDGLRP